MLTPNNPVLHKPFIKPKEADIQEIRQATLDAFIPVVIALGVLLGLRCLRTGGPIAALPVAGMLILGGVGAISLKSRHFRLAKYWMSASVVLATTLEAGFFPDSPARYYYPLAIIMSSLLVSTVNIFALATVCALAYAFVARNNGIGWLDSEQMLSALVLIYLTAFASWLTSWQLHSALGWMRNSYDQARNTLKQLREQRVTLAQTVAALEDAYKRIERMNATLIEANRAAEESRRIKAEFAANISHELRTPLNLIIGFSETMANAPETYGKINWTPSLRGDIEQIYKSSRHLSALIDDILDLSALESKRFVLTMTDTNIGEVIREVTGVMQPLFKAKGLTLKTDLADGIPKMRIDPTRIRQVLINLLNNASRFTREGGVTIRTRLNGGFVTVSIQDTGVGIAPQDIPKVFEEFRQVDGSRSRPHDGTGLGVPLSKRLVELHGGKMWLESKVGTGTTFHFTLPIGSNRQTMKPAGIQTGIRHHQGQEEYRRRLLVSETSPLVLRTLRRHIDSYDIIEIDDNASLPELVEAYQPVALLTSNQNPEIRTDSEDKSAAIPEDLPLITFPLQDIMSRVRALGVLDYLLKPIARKRLLTALTLINPEIETLLIVDDDIRLVDLLERMLQSAGKDYRIIKAYDGAEALEQLRTGTPDLMLLDLTLPDMNGMNVLQTIRQEPALQHIPVMVMSAYEYMDLDEAKGSGLLSLVRRKNFTPTEMLGMLQSLLDSLPLRIPVRPESSSRLQSGPAD